MNETDEEEIGIMLDRYVNGDVPFWQQEMRSCRPNFSLYPTTFFLIFSSVHLAFAIFLAFASNSWSELKFRYDNKCRENVECNISFYLRKTLKKQTFVYYEVTNFYQNHFKFRSSIDYGQLQGKYVTNSGICTKKIDDNSSKPIVVPCGLRAYYAWRDEYKFLPSWNATTEGIAWKGEIGNLYQDLNSNYKDEQHWMKEVPGYEKELRSDKFAIWMRTSPRPHFSKLCAKVQNVVKPGWQSVSITMRTPREVYNGERYLVIVKQSESGGRNLTLIGINCLICFIYVTAALVSAILNNKVAMDPTRIRRQSMYIRSVN